MYNMYPCTHACVPEKYRYMYYSDCHAKSCWKILSHCCSILFHETVLTQLEQIMKMALNIMNHPSFRNACTFTGGEVETNTHTCTTIVRSHWVDPHQCIQALKFHDCSAYVRQDETVMYQYTDIVTHCIFRHVCKDLKLNAGNYCIGYTVKTVCSHNTDE